MLRFFEAAADLVDFPAGVRFELPFLVAAGFRFEPPFLVAAGFCFELPFLVAAGFDEAVLCRPSVSPISTPLASVPKFWPSRCAVLALSVRCSRIAFCIR